MSPDTPNSNRAIEAVFRKESAPVLATLIRQLGDFDRAQDALQEAFVSALEHWKADSLPRNPGAWLLTAARRKGIDRIRREKTASSKEAEVVALVESNAAEIDAMSRIDNSPIPDDMLRLICCCCHPTLAREAQIALTLRTVCGLTTTEIARCFLVPEKTMAQRIVRAKTKIRGAKIPYSVPDAEVLPERIDVISAVIYFIFNEGYLGTSSEGLVRFDLCDEAIHLARLIAGLLPATAELEGLLALLLLQDSRRDARLNAAGQLVILPEQDRALWNWTAISEGQALVKTALARSALGPFQLQAAIAAVHSEAKTAEQTDWAQVIGLYEKLRELGDSAVLRLNQSVAIAMIRGPVVGLELLTSLQQELDDYQSFHAARADFYRRLGCNEDAKSAFLRAQELSENPAVRAYCQRRIDECDASAN